MAEFNVKRTPIIRFSIFELDLNAGELRRNGAKVKIQEQPFRILATLLERPGEIVTKEELRNELWPADTFVDFDHGLNAAVRGFVRRWVIPPKLRVSWKRWRDEDTALLAFPGHWLPPRQPGPQPGSGCPRPGMPLVWVFTGLPPLDQTKSG